MAIGYRFYMPQINGEHYIAQINGHCYAARVCDGIHDFSEAVKNIVERTTMPMTALVGNKLPKGTSGYHEPGENIGSTLYSSMLRYGNDVYWNRNLNTYYSALANPTSVMYAQAPDHTGEYYRNFYGGVCSTFATKALGFPFPYTTYELFNSDTLCPTVRQSVSEYELGDIVVREGTSVGHVGFISRIDKDESGNVVCIEHTDQWTTGIQVKEYTPDEFADYLLYGADTPGESSYQVRKNENQEAIKLFQDVLYATDIYFEYGTDTYVTADETAEMWFYIPGATGAKTVYVKKDNGAYSSYSVSSTKSVNGYPVYNLASCFSGVGDYAITTNKDNLITCNVKVIDIGTITYDDATRELTFAGYQNCQPCYYDLVRIQTGDEKYGNPYDAPAGYKCLAQHSTSQKITSDRIVVSKNNIEYIKKAGRAGYKLQIFFDTKYGWKRVLTDNIMFT